MAVTRLHILNMVVMALAGLVILALSLLTANSLTMRGAGIPAQQWKFYMGREILPDNILYPVLMVRDRVRHDWSPDTDQVSIKLEYAEDRYNTSQALLKQEQGMLAVSALTKSQKYIISAGYQLLSFEHVSVEQLQHVKSTIETSIQRLEYFSREYPEYDQPILSELREESRILLLKIDERLSKM